VARELHDTLVQTVHGSKLVADDALETSDPVRMRRALEQLTVWLARATDEGRAALNVLRTSITARNGLAEAYRRAMEDCVQWGSTKPSFSVVGKARDVHPVVRDEVYRIGYEAIRNACMHSRGSRVEVLLSYTQDLSIRITDNGIGIDPAIADWAKDGHFGLQGMRERAVRIGGKLNVISSADSGTEITVIVPGGIAFQLQRSNEVDRIKAVFRRKSPDDLGA
jgi:signal transduction histidine kinase